MQDETKTQLEREMDEMMEVISRIIPREYADADWVRKSGVKVVGS
jgi:hypothetical protein